MKQCKKIIQLIIIILLITYILYQGSPIIHAYGNAPEAGTPEIDNSSVLDFEAENMSITQLREEIKTLMNGISAGSIPNTKANQEKLKTYQEVLVKKQTGSNDAPNNDSTDESISSPDDFEAENMSITQLTEKIKSLMNGMAVGTVPNTKANQQKLKIYQEVLVKKQKESNGVPNAPSSDPIGDPIINPDDYKPDTEQDNSEIINIGNTIVGIIKVVGSLIAVGALVVMGIKYMFGSIESKAEYKKSMIPYIIGAVLLFASTQITGIIYDYVQKITQ